MNDSKLPISKNNQLIQPSQSTHLEVVKGLNTSKYLFAAGIITIIGAIGVFALTQYTILSVFLAIATLVFFGARQLVRKSLALTTSKE